MRFAASVGCFLVGCVLVVALTLNSPDDMPTVPIMACITSQHLRNAAFFLLGADSILCWTLASLWWTAKKSDAKLAKFKEEEPKPMERERRYSFTGSKRSAFTLMELVVVMAIIAILASLLLIGIAAVVRRGPEVSNKNDVMQLGIGLAKFRTKFGFYPPARMKLCAKFSDYDMTKLLDQNSATVLSSMWPNIDRSQVFQWSGPAPVPSGGVILEGHQCLVFFLGGIPNGKAPTGFWINPQNPTVQPPGATDKLSFFEFDRTRCALMSGSAFPSYLDSHAPNNQKKMPFAYFATYKRPDYYSPFGTSDNASLSVSPYVESNGPPVKYWNSSSYQIISAGRDGVFAPGGLWNPGIVSGGDDISNFYEKNLGS